MRKYELVIVYQPNLEEKKDKLLKALKDFLSKEETTIVSHQWWGKKKLAYEIQKQSEGLYLFTELTSTSSTFGKLLDGEMKIDDQVMRYLLVRREEDSKKTKKRKQKAKK